MGCLLVIPVHLDALVLTEDQMVVEAMADFSLLPYSDGKRDLNPDVANISEEIVSTPFQNQTLLLVDAFYDQVGNEPLPLLRMERLSADVLICLFEGAFNHRVEIHQKPETLHFGVDKPDADHLSLYKELRDIEGNESNQTIDPLPWRLGSESRVIDVKAMASKSNSAQFALQMIEGVEKVVFCSG